MNAEKRQWYEPVDIKLCPCGRRIDFCKQSCNAKMKKACDHFKTKQTELR